MSKKRLTLELNPNDPSVWLLFKPPLLESIDYINVHSDRVYGLVDLFFKSNRSDKNEKAYQ